MAAHGILTRLWIYTAADVLFRSSAKRFIDMGRLQILEFSGMRIEEERFKPEELSSRFRLDIFDSRATEL
jgi:hypothetical protein